MNIAEGPTQKILNEILSIKASETAESSLPQSQQSDTQHSLNNNKSNSIEITKISMKYPLNSKVENEGVDTNQQQQQHQMMTRKRTNDFNDNEAKKCIKRRR